MKQLFPTKNILMTRGVQTLLTDYLDRGDCISPTILMTDISKMLEKHFANMGEECYADKRLNKQAIKNMEGRVFSTFTLNNIKFFIITDGLHLYNSKEYGKVYPYTTIMLSEEY